MSVFTDDKRVNGYRSDIEVARGISRAAQDANERERTALTASQTFSALSSAVPFTSRNALSNLNWPAKFIETGAQRKNPKASTNCSL